VNVGNIPTPKYSITVTSPNGGEVWSKGTTQTITWQDNTPWPPCPANTGCMRPQRAYDIKLFSYYPSSCVLDVCTTGSRIIATGVYASSYNWTIPNCTANNSCSSNFDIPADSYTIQVCQSGTNICDSSDSSFKITNVINGTTTFTCDGLQSSSTPSSYFNSCKNQGFDKVCFNKYSSEYQGCGQSSYNDCTVNNMNASQNIWCDTGTKNSSLSISTGAILPNARVGQAYSAAIYVSGGSGSYFRTGEASFPIPGLGFTSSYGNPFYITGTPARIFFNGVESSVSNTFTFIVHIASGSQSVSKRFSLTVDPY
jgi:hypothetical protein